MQSSRLFEIIYLLLDKKNITARELAEHFEVSKRTILRDVDTLSAAGVPIVTAQGKGGGISLMEGYVLNKAALTEDEQNQILLGLQSLGAAQFGEADGILAKLGALFQKQDTSWIEVDFTRWGQGSSDNLRFELLKRAILGRTAIAFEYVSSYGETSDRVVYPLKLVFKSRAWYLQGFCADRQDYRTFRLSRMLRLRDTGEHFSADMHAAPPIENADAPPLSTVALELRFPVHVAYRVYDEFDEGSIHKEDNGFLRVFANLPDDNWLHGFLLSFGGDVEILAPAEICERFSGKPHKR